jgi:hypothetical protein
MHGARHACAQGISYMTRSISSSSSSGRAALAPPDLGVGCVRHVTGWVGKIAACCTPSVHARAAVKGVIN